MTDDRAAARAEAENATIDVGESATIELFHYFVRGYAAKRVTISRADEEEATEAFRAAIANHDKAASRRQPPAPSSTPAVTREALAEAAYYASESPSFTRNEAERITDAILALLNAAPSSTLTVTREQRDAINWAAVLALVESPRIPTGVRAELLGEVYTIREQVDAYDVIDVALDAILALLNGGDQ